MLVAGGQQADVMLRRNSAIALEWGCKLWGQGVMQLSSIEALVFFINSANDGEGMVCLAALWVTAF